MRYDPKDIDKMPGEVGRLLRCIQMAMGCLSPLTRDEKLAWYRLLDAIEGREPRKSLDDDRA
jgi:hypothetical protein